MANKSYTNLKISLTPLGQKEDSGLFYNIVLIVICILILGIMILASFISVCEVFEHSMEPTLFEYDNVLLLKNPTDFKHDDIVVVTITSNGETKDIIKRVIGKEGDTLKFIINQNGTIDLYRKENSQSEFYLIDESNNIKAPMDPRYFNTSHVTFGSELIVPQNTLFVMGDNRNNSRDSREYGFINTSQVVGKMIYILQKDSLLERFFLFLY